MPLDSALELLPNINYALLTWNPRHNKIKSLFLCSLVGLRVSLSCNESLLIWIRKHAHFIRFLLAFSLALLMYQVLCFPAQVRIQCKLEPILFHCYIKKQSNLSVLTPFLFSFQAGKFQPPTCLRNVKFNRHSWFRVEFAICYVRHSLEW